MAWEVERECCELTGSYFDVYHRGDIFTDDMNDFIALLDSVDPQAVCAVVLCAGPPCVDYSDIKGGPEGSKFVTFCRWQRDLKDRLEAGPRD